MEKNRVVGALALGVMSAVNPLQAAEKQPNLVLFLADDCSYYDLGCYGSVDSKTPNIDQFAKEGMLFTRGYEMAPMSSPTRHNLYTGVASVKSGAYPNHTNLTNPDTETIVQKLRPLGYKVALFGKSHIAPKEKFDFDTYVPANKSGDVPFMAVENFMKKCIAAGEPYCILVACHEPHSPWTKGDRSQFNADKLTLPPMWVDTPETRSEFVNYLAEVNYMDAAFGRTLSILDKHKQRDNSLVVYLSEQGNSFPFAKWTLYDVGVHSAYIVRYPNVIKANTTSDAIVEYSDIVPTFVDFAGGAKPTDVDGDSIKEVLLGNKKSHNKYTCSIQTTRGIIAGSPFFGIRSACDGEYRYIWNLTPEATFENAAINSPTFESWIKAAKGGDDFAKQMVYKYQHRPSIELYNVVKDPYCMDNLAENKKYKSKIAELDKVLKEWMKECGDKGAATEMEALDHMTGRQREVALARINGDPIPPKKKFHKGKGQGQAKGKGKGKKK